MNKKLLTSIILSTLIFSNSAVFAQTNIVAAPIQATKSIFQTSLETEINDAIIQIYGDNYAPEIQRRVMEIAQKAKSNRPEELKKEDLLPNILTALSSEDAEAVCVTSEIWSIPTEICSTKAVCS